eukprot:scaffold20734_cov82-Skeletonema_dohrnii-CCMP3373.AAC.2
MNQYHNASSPFYPSCSGNALVSTTIANYASPPDINALFLTDKASVQLGTELAELSTGEFTRTSKFLLDESLRRSLPNVLKQINPSLSNLPDIMHDIKHSHHDNGCFTEEEHQILLSGSVMVQTATGKCFTSPDDVCDVDVFVCRHNAAKLRKALTERGFVCSNLFVPYTPRRVLHMFELQGINHVEQYIIKDDAIATITADERLNRELFQGFQEDEDFMIHRDGAILDDLLRSGEMPHDFPFVTNPGIRQPRHVIDAIVSNEDSSPQQIIDTFDITACKGTYNGDEFYIPDSSRTFMNTSTSNLWTHLSNAYFAKLLIDPPDSFCAPNDRGVGPACNPNDPQDSVHRRHIFRSLEQAEIEVNFPRGAIDHTLLRNSNEYLKCVHGSLERHLSRAFKYIKRGIYVYPIDRFVVRQCLGDQYAPMCRVQNYPPYITRSTTKRQKCLLPNVAL